MVRSSVFGKDVVAAMMAVSLLKRIGAAMTSEHGKPEPSQSTTKIQTSP
jgi:hypothetical protein